MFKQGIKGRYLHKHATFLWLSLCLAIFLSSLPQKALFDRNIFSCSHELDQSLQPVQTQIVTNDSIHFPDGFFLPAKRDNHYPFFPEFVYQTGFLFGYRFRNFGFPF